MDRELVNCLDVIQEECAEMIVAISKIKRFGFDSYHPDDPEKITNANLFIFEMADLLGAIDKLCQLTDAIDKAEYTDEAVDRADNKPAKIDKYFEYTKKIEGIE